MRLLLNVVGWIVSTFMLIGVVIVVIAMVNPYTNSTSVSVRARPTERKTVKQETEIETEAEVDEYVICDNEYLRATFLGIGDSFGYITLDVKLENKTDGEITVIPMDSSVDDVMVQFLSGLPATMQGHKSMNQAWLIGSEPQNNIEFKLWIVDENWSDLYKTETIRLVR